jgi:Tfp pilus assembly protein PilN
MRAVNLIPTDRGRRSRRKKSRSSVSVSPVLVLAFLAVVAVVAGVVVEARSASSTVAARQQALSAVQAEIAKVPKPDVPSPGVVSKLSVVTSVAGQRTSWDGFLSAVSRVIPEDVWLVNLSATAPVPTAVTPGSSTVAADGSTPAPAPAAANGFTMTGYTYSEPSVARLMRRLTLVPWLSNVSLTTSAKSSMANHTVYQFTLGANVISLPEVGS